MSSLRNSLHRRNHKERGQLAHRKRLGILEKHKDYVLRAKDYNSKKERIRKLKQKISERNKDEFYFGMVGKKTQGGVHAQDRGNLALPTELVKVLKTQDENYIRTVRAENLRRIDGIKVELTSVMGIGDLGNDESVECDALGALGLDEEDVELLREAGLFQISSTRSKGRKVKHIVFMDDESGAKLYEPPARPAVVNPKESTTGFLVDRGWLAPATSSDTKGKKREPMAEPEDVEMKSPSGNFQELSKTRRNLLQTLRGRLTRHLALTRALRELEMQRILMGKGAGVKIRGPEPVNRKSKQDQEDEEDAFGGRRRKVKTAGAPSMEEYKPRVYKFRPERKK